MIEKVLKDMTASIKVEKLTSLSSMDIEDLIDATVDTMKETLGFNIGTQNIGPLNRNKIANYWEGVLLVPERELFVGRLDGTVAGAAQLVKPAPSNATSKFACSLDNLFVAPWARGHGLSNLLLENVEKQATANKFEIIKVSVRETRESAIKLFERRGYKRWGVLPKYELDQGKVVSGYFYYKDL